LVTNEVFLIEVISHFKKLWAGSLVRIPSTRYTLEYRNTDIKTFILCFLGCGAVWPGMWVPALLRNIHLQGIGTDEAVCSSGTR
jgi:hypothetical protein